MSKKILIVSIGAIVGFLYYNFFGCNMGCSITSSPINSTIYGALFGFVISMDSIMNKK